MIACFSAGVPSTAVYLVSPLSMARFAASLMFCGVSKSGSPAPRPMMSRPAALRRRALSVTAMVGDGLMRPRRAARSAAGLDSASVVVIGPSYPVMLYRAMPGNAPVRRILLDLNPHLPALSPPVVPDLGIKRECGACVARRAMPRLPPQL